MEWVDFLRIIAKILPVIILLALGFFIKVKKFISIDTVNDLKKIIVNISLLYFLRLF